VKTLEFDSFGAVLADSDPSFYLPIGFAGGLTDPVTGLVRFGFRDYEPGSGRWTARDPILYEGGQANLYVYVSNDPVSSTDPSGLIGKSCPKPLLDAYLTVFLGIYAADKHHIPQALELWGKFSDVARETREPGGRGGSAIMKLLCTAVPKRYAPACGGAMEAAEEQANRSKDRHHERFKGDQFRGPDVW
jgi:RHS repeat-associated protein